MLYFNNSRRTAMKSVTTWSFAPFVPFNEPGRALLPYICRISPGIGSVTFDWFDRGDSGPHRYELKKRFSDEIIESGSTCAQDQKIGRVRIDNLTDGIDYTISIVRESDGLCATRLVRCGDYLGDTVINYLHPEDPAYSFSGYALCSPSIAMLPDRRLVSAMDVYRGGAPQNLSIVYTSDDGGATWDYQCELYPCFWPRMFVHRGQLYCAAVSTEYGDLLIGRSDDRGESWAAPTRLMPGTFNKCGPHKNPVPFVEIGGRVWSSCEYGSWAIGYHDMGLFSAPADADLTDISAWVFTPFMRYDPKWKGAPADSGIGKKCPGAGIEGNVVETPDHEAAVLYRMDIAGGTPNCGKSVMLRADKKDPEAPLSFDAIVDNPLGSNSKFCIKRDDVTGLYIEIGTLQDDASDKRTRIAMAVSSDLYNWRVVHLIFDIRGLDSEKNGLQYPDFVIDGDDLLVVTRTALNGAANFHDSNCSMFKRIHNFREYIK